MSLIRNFPTAMIAGAFVAGGICTSPVLGCET